MTPRGETHSWQGIRRYPVSFVLNTNIVTPEYCVSLKETPADFNSTTRAVPPVHLHRLQEINYEMEEVHMGFGLLDQTSIIS